MAGDQASNLYGVDHFKTVLFDVAGVAMVALRNAGVTEVRGILGLEMFPGQRAVFDQTSGRVTAGPSTDVPLDSSPWLDTKQTRAF